MKYLVRTFKTLTGDQVLIDLGDQAYGEWIVYENNAPKFHASCFKESSKSDSLLRDLIENDKWTFEALLARINHLEQKKLSLGKHPLIEIEVTSELKEIELEPIPVEWLGKMKTEKP